ncbi:MAG TPA: hypothetical protein VM925_03480 [Labilithrix sp.]|nr:hypothetical protein [Labilithrix sp.]
MIRSLYQPFVMAVSVLGASLTAGCTQEVVPEERGATQSELGGGCSMSMGNGRNAVNTLRCTNRPNITMYEVPSTESARVNVLRSSDSWFSCWGRGVRHSGGNDTWYGTVGDDTRFFGFVPAAHLNTTSDFDRNPSAAGLPVCARCDKGTGRCPTKIIYD